jgi:hypothetical protein
MHELSWGLIAQAPMQALFMSLPAGGSEHTPGRTTDGKIYLLRHTSHTVLPKRSPSPFYYGPPWSLSRVSSWCGASQPLTAGTMNSGP